MYAKASKGVAVVVKPVVCGVKKLFFYAIAWVDANILQATTEFAPTVGLRRSICLIF
jgi:hypothetical protein